LTQPRLVGQRLVIGLWNTQSEGERERKGEREKTKKKMRSKNRKRQRKKREGGQRAEGRGQRAGDVPSAEAPLAALALNNRDAISRRTDIKSSTFLNKSLR
jgi:hypothetical protein